MHLEDNEIRDITKYLEEGKPLPDKYRFLLFEEKREVELVWNGKTNEVCNIVLPFQIIEQIDEPREEKNTNLQLDFSNLDERGRQLRGWTNKLIWGDNKLILSSLKNGPLREEIEKEGGIKLIYIDPPFDVGADFSMNIEIGDNTFTKEPGILEEIAYRDTWGKGADSFIVMLHERLTLMKDLLSDNGSIFVHCDWRVSAFVKLILDEIFEKDNFRNEIVWNKVTAVKSQSKYFSNIKDSIFYYTKSDNSIFVPQYVKSEKDDKNYPYLEEETKRKYGSFDFTQKGPGPARKFGDKILTPPPGKHWIWSQEKIDEGIKNGTIIFTSSGFPRVKRYLDAKEGNYLGDIWSDELVLPIQANSSERNDYPTQKPEALLERIIKASSKEDDLVADFFCGSGTTLAVAEKLGRKWIGSDLSKFAIHTTRKRMIEVQRRLKREKKNYRAFEILNLGKYERQHYVGINPNLREIEKQKQLAKKEKDFITLILKAYRAEEVNGFNIFQGKKNNRLVSIGPVNLPVTRLFVEEVIKECIDKPITKADILGFEFEMSLFPNMLEEAKNKGIDLAVKYIPRDVFDKRAVEKNQVVFHDVSYIEVKPHFKGKSIAIELTDFSVFYNQDIVANVEANLKNGISKVVVECGQIIKILKDKDGIIKREVLTKKWTDWIDYWSVDFDFENKKEIIRIKIEDYRPMSLSGKDDHNQLQTEQYKDVWTGEYIFENEWQSFRTKKDRNLELISIFKECIPGPRKIAAKVVDIFGNDTMKVITVNI
ncbi:MAG: site-specific DNA-methyltransferase [Actinobacteria bacterium]|nr:site-specific DNA-methyltransferase [Actinomycetota bacterium]